MKKIFLLFFSAIAFSGLLKAQDIMLQGWYWDYPKTSQGKWWVDTIAQKSQQLAGAGFNYLWLPPMSLAGSGQFSNGYDLYDLYNLGGTFGANTGFGNRIRIDKMIDSLSLYHIVPIADMIFNHRTNGKPENNEPVEGWIENYNLTKHNNGDACYPSDRFRCILPIGNTTGLDSGIYYFKIHSASGSTDYYSKPYTVYMYTKKKGWANLPDLVETASNGGADCGQGNDNISLGRKIKATVDPGGCGTDEFELSISGADYFAAGDTIFITINNDNGDYSDHFIYGIWYSSSAIDVAGNLRYQTYTDFSSVPSGRGDMHYFNFKPNGNPTCLCGDWDGMYFYYDVDQFVPSTIDTLNGWAKWMMQDVGVSGLRLDAVKHFTPEFTGNLLDYLHDNGFDPKIVVGESYDYDASILKTRIDEVYNNMDQDTKDAIYYSVFDFSLQSCLRDACDAFGYDARNVFGCGMHDSQQIYRKNIVTFVNDHDFREPPQAVDTDPILAYTYILTNPVVGIPCVYWSDYFSSDYPSYEVEMNNIIRSHYNFIQGALDVDYLNRFNTPYGANYISGNASSSLVYQLSNMSNTCLPDVDVIVAINFSGDPLKVDIATNTSAPYHLQVGDTLVDILGRSNFPYAIVNGSNQVYIDLPARSYSIWAKVSPIVASPAIAANGPVAFCNGSQVTLNQTSAFYPCHNYQWKKNGTAIYGATASSYIAAVSGDYTLSESYNGVMEHLSNIITVSVSPEHPTIQDDGTTLSCAVTNVNYQWSFGATNTSLVPIPGATSQEYQPAASGFYSVTVTDAANCEDVSDVLQHWMVGVNDPPTSSQIHLFPDPASDAIHLELGSFATRCKSIRVFNKMGELMISISPSRELNEVETIDVSQFSPGIYFTRIICENGVFVKQFVKQ